MPSLTFNEVQKFSSFPTQIFVETGTYIGNTLINVCSYFENIYSIELEKYYYDIACDKFKNNKNITIIHGDSSKILDKLCDKLDKPTFFWLDGHWSGSNTGRGDKDCPLIEEIKHINQYMKLECIIAIDDVRLFETYINEDWSYITKEKILELVKDRLISCQYFSSEVCLNDRMVLTLKSI